MTEEKKSEICLSKLAKKMISKHDILKNSKSSFLKVQFCKLSQIVGRKLLSQDTTKNRFILFTESIVMSNSVVEICLLNNS